jgi:predicted ArsR family transcriptional regulator
MNSEQHVFGHGTRLEAAPRGAHTGLSERIDLYLSTNPDSSAREIAAALGEQVGAVQSSLKLKKAAGDVRVTGLDEEGSGALRYSIGTGEPEEPAAERRTAEQRVREFMADHPGMTVAQIAQALEINKSAAQKAIELLTKKKEAAVCGLHHESKKPPQKKYRLWDGETPMPTPAPIKTELTPRLAQSLDEVRRKLRRNDSPIQPQSIAVLRELEKILDPSIAEVLEQIRKHLEEAA